MTKLTTATVISPTGLRVDESVRLKLPDSMIKRFEDALARDKKGNPVLKNGCHELTRKITLKSGMKINIDLDSLTRRQQLSLDYTSKNNNRVKKEAQPQGSENNGDLTEKARNIWSLMTPQEQAKFSGENEYISDYIEMIKAES
jgi:hypothetical protein